MNVTVLLNDPRLPDLTKVGGVQSPEDREAQARMRAALARIPEHRFTLLDDHAELLRSIGRPDLVLNLCGSGFRNVSARELHVPALLEILGLPYTGSPPACLALCYDKSAVGAVAAAHGIPVPGEWTDAAGAR